MRIERMPVPEFVCEVVCASGFTSSVARCPAPKLVLNGSNSYFLVWGPFLGVHLLLAMLHGAKLQNG
jgi:hypothetical protein